MVRRLVMIVPFVLLLYFVAIKGFEPLSTILHGFGRRVCYMGRKPASSHLFITRGVSGLQHVSECHLHLRSSSRL